MSNPHSLVSENPVVMLVRMCAECDTPIVEVPAGKRGWYCVGCGFYPSMEDTYMLKVEVKPA